MVVVVLVTVMVVVVLVTVVVVMVSGDGGGLSVFMSWLYAMLAESSKQYLEELEVFHHVSAEDWYVVYRAGLMSKQCKIRSSALSKPLARRRSQTYAKGSFFIDVGMLRTTMVVQI